LIIRKIVKIVTTRCHILKLKYTKRSSRTLAGYKRLASKGREGRKDGREGRGRSERGGEGKQGEKRGKNHTGTFSPLRVLMMVNLKSLVS